MIFYIVMYSGWYSSRKPRTCADHDRKCHIRLLPFQNSWFARGKRASEGKEQVNGTNSTTILSTCIWSDDIKITAFHLQKCTDTDTAIHISASFIWSEELSLHSCPADFTSAKSSKFQHGRVYLSLHWWHISSAYIGFSRSGMPTL